jgi:redox-sensing transcriptional repressor
MKKTAKIPYAAIERLALYSRPLRVLLKNGITVISSEKLAEYCGVNPAQVRKDLAYFGEFGVRGVGYDVTDLLREIKSILATDRDWTLCIIGMGNLGNAIVENENFRKMGYRFVAAFDKDQEKHGKTLPCGLIIQPMERLRHLVKLLNVQIGVITTPPDEAQRVTDLLVDAGVKGVLNFSPTQVKAPKGCVVENVDFAVRFENLAYHLSKVPRK